MTRTPMLCCSHSAPLPTSLSFPTHLSTSLFPSLLPNSLHNHSKYTVPSCLPFFNLSLSHSFHISAPLSLTHVLPSVSRHLLSVPLPLVCVSPSSSNCISLLYPSTPPKSDYSLFSFSSNSFLTQWKNKEITVSP